MTKSGLNEAWYATADDKKMFLTGCERCTSAGYYCYGVKGRDGMAPPCARCKHMSKKCVGAVCVDENSDDDVVVEKGTTSNGAPIGQLLTPTAYKG